MAPGSTTTRFHILATKQTTPIDGAIQKLASQVFTHWKNMPMDQVSALYMDHGSDGTCFCILATKQSTPIDGAIKK